jgi:hypothetical protein
MAAVQVEEVREGKQQYGKGSALGRGGRPLPYLSYNGKKTKKRGVNSRSKTHQSHTLSHG